jgi:protein TonB
MGTLRPGSCPRPAYPEISKRLEEEGTVVLRFLVAPDGKVLQADVEKSSGFKRLDDAARQGLANCTFEPATVDGKPVRSWATVPYTWRLE